MSTSYKATLGTTYTSIADFSALSYQKGDIEIQSNGSQQLEFVWFYGSGSPTESTEPHLIVNTGLASGTYKGIGTRRGKLFGRCQSETVAVVVNAY